MISPRLKRFIEKTAFAFVASADQRARPHLAVASHLLVSGDNRIVFESWVCPKTLENINEVPRIALAIIDPATASGYQLECLVVKALETKLPMTRSRVTGMHQVQARIEVRVEAIYEFAPGPHNDQPLGLDS